MANIFRGVLSFLGIDIEDVDDNKKEEPARNSKTRQRAGATSSVNYGQTALSSKTSGRSYGSSGRAAQYSANSASWKYKSSTTASQPEEPSPAEDEWENEEDTRKAEKSSQRKRAAANRSRSREAEDTQTEPSAEMDIFTITEFEKTRDAIRCMMNGHSVFINVEELADDISQRVIDTLYGAALALDAKVRTVSKRSFLISPKNVKTVDR